MDGPAALAAFDAQVRRHPAPSAGARVERDGHIIRTVSDAGGWNGVSWCDLDSASAGPAIAAQVRRFAQLGRPWEWKYYSYDRPEDLPERLSAAGLVPEEEEALLVAELADLRLDQAPPDGVELRAVVDREGIDALVTVHDEVFGEDHGDLRRTLAAAIEREPSAAAAVIAFAGPIPIAAGRVEFHSGTEFASLWGGGTLPAWRGHGVFRSLVAHRAALAAARGFRYLQVDASPQSRTILQRLGFAELATTIPFTHPGFE